MLIISDRAQIEHEYADYFSDESRLVGQPVSTLCFPETDVDVQAAIMKATEEGVAITVSGGRTGIVGGAVTGDADMLVSLERMQNPLRIGWDEKQKKFFVRAAAGHLLSTVTDYLATDDYTYVDDVQSHISKQKLWFPVNPTEATAQVGGAVATNASGSRSYYFGAMRQWVRRIRVVLADGSMVDLHRGTKSENGFFKLSDSVRVPACAFTRPQTKQTLGYYLPPEADLIDLFIGSEGTLGIITEVDLFLSEEPSKVLGQMIIFNESEALMAALLKIKENSALCTVAIEYYDPHALALLRGHDVPLVKELDEDSCALYVESYYESEEDLDQLFSFYDQLLTEYDVSDKSTWAAFDDKNLGEMSELRHSIPETINRIISDRKKNDPKLRKLSTDMAVPEAALAETLALYERTLQESGLEYLIFGHIGEGNLHINILPQKMEDLIRAEELYASYAEYVISQNGAIAAEHGIGRVKKELFKKQFSPDALNQMKQLKALLDPDGVFNPGVLFD